MSGGSHRLRAISLGTAPLAGTGGSVGRAQRVRVEKPTHLNPTGTNLRHRGPSFAVMDECLKIQSSAPPRGRTANLLGRTPLHPAARNWYRGALGEVVVANVLATLGPEWTVLHAVPTAAGQPDIDHLLIGPAGVFTINTRTHSGSRIWIGGGTFLANGIEHDHMLCAAAHARGASELLSRVTGRSISVTPLIVVVNPASINVGRKSPFVAVLTSNNLSRWLLKKPGVLSERAVRHFSMFAEERSTWCSDEAVADPSADRVQHFEELRGRVDAARRRRRGWWIAALGTLGVGAPIVAMEIITIINTALL